ncbi:MAG TPA: hypothetical protein VMW92_01920 [Candidatus Heimdallarchaeota archaeon]|jgi:hypothetical protein|nr:hypothetical protein [Candidatus Heimdallarchaeota archaeon]
MNWDQNDNEAHHDNEYLILSQKVLIIAMNRTAQEDSEKGQVIYLSMKDKGSKRSHLYKLRRQKT